MRTILHIIDTTGPGGAETVFIALADKTREHGYQSLAVIRGQGWVHDELQKRQVPTVILDAKGRFNWRYLCSLMALVRQERVSLIQSHMLGANVYSALAGWITGVPVVGTFHGMVDISPTERFRALKLWLMERGIRRFIAVSHNLAGAIEAQKLLNRDKTGIIYNGVDLDCYRRPKSTTLRRQLEIPDGAPVIGCLGNIRPAKGYDVLIRAIASLQEEFIDLHVIVAGHQKSSLMNSLNALMMDLDVSSRFHFIGFQQDSAEFLKQLDLFVLSSTSEGFSISTIEAMAAGLPVLATRCGGPEEILEPGEDGLLVEAANPEALATGIRQLLTNPKLCQTLALSAQKSVREKFSEDSMLEKYLAVYQQYRLNT